MASPSASEREAAFRQGIAQSGRFFMGDSDVHRALAKLIATFDEQSIPYAIVGAMALNEYGYRRATSDVDVLLTRESLDRWKAHVLGRGYVEKFAGSKGVRDTENNVVIDVLLAGDYPGDGVAKPVRFPDPASAAIRGPHGAFLPLHQLIELKLAAGLTAPHRLKDLADVLELVRITHLERELGAQLDPSVRAKYDELWQAAQAIDPRE